MARRDAHRLAAFEQSSLADCDGVIAISAADQAQLEGLIPGVPKCTLPPSFDTPRCVPSPSADAAGRIRLGFLGNLGWWPNRAALDWFLESIWPHVPDTFELHVFGNGSECLPTENRVHGHGYVADLGQVWRTVQLFVQPIVAGGGVNIKVAEAIYQRRPMLATSKALQGCGLSPDPAIVVADVMDAFCTELWNRGVVATIRRTRGEDIAAACGQLAGQIRDRTNSRLGSKHSRAAHS